ncbi:MAG: hypothetical protein NT011_10200 [Kiritimatiellaeota bacterium]|nr:hypothetical protein [Kiritimatiellota bacterium]
MSPFGLQHELIRIGRILNRWQAEIRTVLLIAAALASLWLLTLSDLVFRYQRTGRLAAWLLLMAGVAVGLWYVITALRTRRTPEGVAARIEHTFPKLDNHLINTLQFSQRTNADPMEQQYVERNAPDWSVIKVPALRDRKTQWRSYAVLFLAGLTLIATGAWIGGAWNNALVRMLNPFSPRTPTTLAIIHSVTPGNSTILKGAALALACKVSGKKGQIVYLDLWPEDDKRSVMKLGRMTGDGEETYAYQIPRIATGYQYRFRAGDAVSERFTVQALPPLAFSRIEVAVTPPTPRLRQGSAGQARLGGQRFDGLTATPSIPQDSILAFDLKCNREITSATVMTTNPVSLLSPDRGQSWSGQVVLASTRPLVITARDAHGATAETTLKIEIIPDAAPMLRIIAPTGRTRLAAGAAPRIQWEVSDDFGLTQVRLETIAVQDKSTGQDSIPGTQVQEWPLDGTRAFATNWNGEGFPFSMTEPLAFRIVAVDDRAGGRNGAGGEPNRTISAPIIFEWNTPKDVASQNKAVATKLAEAVKGLVERQRENLEKTTKLEAVQQTAKPAEWQDTAQAQQVIRKIAGQLIADPKKPLGPLTEPVRKLYLGTMAEVVDVLTRVSGAESAQKTVLAKRAILLETRILRVLTGTEAGLDTVKRNQEITGLLGQLDALVKGQDTALVQTKASVTNAVKLNAALVDKQDRLAGALTEFVQACRKDATTLTASDMAFSKILIQIADGCESNKLAALMLKAAECLQNKQPATAIPPQSKTLAALTEFQKLLNGWRIQEATQTASDMREALQEASKKMDKLIELESKSVEAMRETLRQEDKSKKPLDDLEEEYVELHEQMKDSLLEIATDLQIFPELPVGNDLVEDVFQVYEEVKQKLGTDKAAIQEIGLQKEDWLLALNDALKDTKKRIDDTETWLPADADNRKALTENFDQAEMPKVPIIPMPGEMEDIIGDLAEQEEELEKKSDDSATNQGAADILMGWDIKEGEWVSYSGKGKSGNTRPDHKEQDGRSNVGRSGMADGETSAGSGKINAGDENIDKRMTQDSSQSGQVQEDGHSKAKATGGGKGSGYGDELGMAGSGPRRDSKITQGSELGLQAMLKRNAQALYARSELSHVRTGSLDEAIRWMQQAEGAIAKGYPAQQVREFQRNAVTALKKSQTELGGAVMDSADATAPTAPPIDDQLAGVRDEAPSAYRELVSEYFKSLSSAP